MNKKIGYKIKRKREEKNFSQEAMAEMLDISQKSYSNIENGKNSSINTDRLLKISEILEIDILDFFKDLENISYNKITNSQQNGFVFNNVVNSEEINAIIQSMSKIFEQALLAAINNLKNQL